MAGLNRIRKRDGRVVGFDKSKIANAIFKAMEEVGEEDFEIADELAEQVEEKVAERFEGKDELPGVEDIQDQVEITLIKNGLAKTAKAYILYRHQRKQVRETKKDLLPEEIDVEDKLIKQMGINSIKVLERRYLMRGEEGRILETPKGMIKRVAKDIAKAEENYENGDKQKWEKEFFEMMENLDFLPNSPTLMNAGAPLQQLAACFVLPIEDDLEQIFNTVRDTALIHQSGGGTGFDFSDLRPKGDLVKSTKGVASGPVSFMTVFDRSTEVIKQGGKRRGANMGIMRIDHPDILEFITAKSQKNQLNNFNISVSITEDFMEKVKKGEDYNLINPRNGEVHNTLNAKKTFDLIATLAWNSGDPGIVFLDRINRDNPTPDVGRIASTNPCGEQPLLPYESCNLGSVNLANHVKGEGEEAEVYWDKLKETVHNAVRFLDNVIDRGEYPLKKIEDMVKRNRKIGLGVMGFADMLIKLRIKYDSQEGIDTAEKVMEYVNREAKKASQQLAKERGPFPGYETSVYGKDPKEPEIRNATRTTIAPTGTISIISNCSGGIEPLFAISYIRNVMDNTRMIETNDLFEKIARKRGFYSEELMGKIAKQGGCQDIEEVPQDVKEVFRTAHDITPRWHVKMQGAFQRHIDNAVSKTVNFPSDATIEDVKEVYQLAYKEGCKGATIYRSGSLSNQPMNIGNVETEAETTDEYVESKVEDFENYEKKQRRRTKKKQKLAEKKKKNDVEGAMEVEAHFAGDCPNGTCEI